MYRYTLVAGILITALAWSTASTAPADIVPQDDPYEGSSWGQGFFVWGLAPFDLMAVRITSAGDTFESATFRNFSHSGWATTYENTPPMPTLAVAQGPERQWLTTDILFAGELSDPLRFDFVRFSGSSLDESVHLAWTGDFWKISHGTWNPSIDELTAQLPAPSAALLGVLGLAGLGLLRWARRRTA